MHFVSTKRRFQQTKVGVIATVSHRLESSPLKVGLNHSKHISVKTDVKNIVGSPDIEKYQNDDGRSIPRSWSAALPTSKVAGGGEFRFRGPTVDPTLTLEK